MLLAVQQQHGIAAAGAVVGGDQRTQPLAERLRAGVTVADGAGRADRGARAAAHAEVGRDLDGTLAIAPARANRLGRANVDTCGAARGLVTAVGAQAFLVAEELGLLELAHHLLQLQRVGVLARHVGARMQVALRGLVHGEGRGVVEVENEVEARLGGGSGPVEVDRRRRAAGLHAVAMVAAAVQVDLVAEVDRPFRAGIHAGVAARAEVEVDRVALAGAGLPAGREVAEPAGQAGQRAAVDGPGAAGGRRHIADRCAGQQHGDFEAGLGEPARPGQRPRGRAQYQHGAVRAVVHHRHRVGLGERRGGQQGGDLGVGGGRVAARALRPPAGLADIDEAHRRGDHTALARGAGHLGEQRTFLGAGHDDVFRAIERLAEIADFTPAQQAVDLQGTRGIGQCRPVKRHGVVAIADQRRHGARLLAGLAPSSLRRVFRPADL
ncbi:hypothetical protein LMG19282_05346 [Cupriavidus campinensis]|nr:hypothetical protein LMG19282_05346 [Cupriavidus campinensis]